MKEYVLVIREGPLQARASSFLWLGHVPCDTGQIPDLSRPGAPAHPIQPLSPPAIFEKVRPFPVSMPPLLSPALTAGLALAVERAPTGWRSRYQKGPRSSVVASNADLTKVSSLGGEVTSQQALACRVWRAGLTCGGALKPVTLLLCLSGPAFYGQSAG